MSAEPGRDARVEANKAWRSRGAGTHEGPFGPFPPTRRRMEITIVGMHRFEDGRVVETWTSWDNVAALTRLGLLPGP
jgi:predicted ester cyclase